MRVNNDNDDNDDDNDNDNDDDDDDDDDNYHDMQRDVIPDVLLVKKCPDPDSKKSRKHKNHRSQFKEVKEIEGMILGGFIISHEKSLIYSR